MLQNSQNTLEKSLICQGRSGRRGKRKELSHSEESFLAGGSICATSANREKQTSKQKNYNSTQGDSLSYVSINV